MPTLTMQMAFLHCIHYGDLKQVFYLSGRIQERVGLQNGNIVKSKVAYMYVACCMMTFQNLQISVANSKVRVRIGETNF